MASLSTTSINRPVLSIVMSLVIVLFGYIGFSFLGIREFPSVDPPVVTVNTAYIGANADVIESQITEPLEDAINGIAGIRTLTSISREGRSTITVEFELGVNIEAAANDVRDKVSGSLFNLPRDVDPPVVEKADADSSPIIFLSVGISEACQQRRFHRRARAALLGKLHRQAGGRPGRRPLQPAARPVSGQAGGDRRIRLAKRGLQSAQRRSRPVRAGLGAAQFRQARRSHSAWTTTSSRRSTSPGSSSRAASVPIGAS